ncbi:PPC domain-containing protein [Prosthecobacter sp.]|uniref:PPC domain-containing protein n=1 Tax=Prosthecobacter sp. TaxID=1965333 RepID=UPI002ABCB11C|nr:PPC domain-containing protein [Prosthecobacter sp.]MDZ4405881.1 PPC domain-containing protein [Prosthecobacter sp.]
MTNGVRILAFVILHSSFVIPSLAAPPGFENIFPAGGQIGARVEVKVAGAGLEKNSPQAWSSDPKVVVLAGDEPKKFFISIAKDAVPGPCLIRLHTDAGATPPRIIEVGKFEELLEKEPNDALADLKTDDAKMNVMINGVLQKAGDVDTHALRVQKGKAIRLELHGYALGSPMDPALRLLNERGVEIAGGHDTHNLDPRIEHTPATDGVLFVQVFAFAHPPAADVALKGSANHVYRLTVTDEPKKAPLVNEPKTLTIPATITGCIAKAREEDVFTLTAKKGDDLQINVRAQAIRSPLDATLRIEDAEGKSLQQADDGENLDPALRWKAPKDGEFKLVVADRFHQGSVDHGYELTVKPFVPTLTGTLDTHAYMLEAGKTVEVKLNVKAGGTFAGKIQARAAQLPVGVTADLVDVPAKGGEVKLTLKAAPEAAASQAPFAVEIVTSAPDAVQTVLASYAIPFTEPRGDLLITSDTHPWLTVTAKKP